MKPTRFEEDGTAVFCSRDIEDYGLPEEWGYEKYIVIESREINMVTDHKMEQQYDLRPIHRYSRLERFRVTLRQLIGEHGTVPDHIIMTVGHYLMLQGSGDNLWNRTRAILKHFKARIYYNRIPYILKQLKYQQCISWDSQEYEDIMAKFKVISRSFDEQKNKYKRKYFPNLRFIALKLLQEAGGEMNIKIPLARTLRKEKALEKLWLELKNVCG